MKSRDAIFIYFVRLPLITAIVLFTVMGIVSKRGWLDWRRMVRQNGELQVKLADIRRNHGELERQIRLLKSDPSEQERVVRHVLGYVRPDETVVEFE